MYVVRYIQLVFLYLCRFVGWIKMFKMYVCKYVSIEKHVCKYEDNALDIKYLGF